MRAPRLDDVRPVDHRTTAPPGRPDGGMARRPPGKGGFSYVAPPRRRRQRSLLASIMLYAGSGLVLLGVLGLTFLALAPPTDFIRQQAIAAVKQQTGRDLTIRGPASLTFYPAIGISLADVSLSAPAGMSAPATVEMKRLDVAVKLVPLLSRRVEVKQLVLTHPRIDLRIDKAGRTSWEMASAAGPARIRLAEARDASRRDDAGGAAHHLVLAQASAGATRGSPATASLEGLALEDVRIIDGTIEYNDERNGASHRVASLDATVAADKLTSPLNAKGDLEWRGQPIEFNVTANSAASLLEQGRARLAVTVRSKPLALDYSGSADTAAGTGLTLDGNVAVNTPSVRAMLSWVGTDMAPGEGFGPLSLKSRLRLSPSVVSLDGAELALDAIRANGTVQLDTGKARPHVRAELSVAELNLNPYIAAGTTTAQQSAPEANRPASGGRVPAAEPPATTPRSIEDLLNSQRGPQVRGYTARSGWSDEPFDVAALRLVDADAKLTVGRLVVRDIQIGRSDVVLALKGGVARTTFERVELYQGNGRGLVTLDATAARPAIGANIVVDGVQANGLLKDAAAIGWLSGTGRMTLALTAAGSSQRQLVSGLNGRVETTFSDGAVSGFNVGKIARGLSQGQLAGLKAAPAEKTDFSELAATFDIVNGLATNQDLRLLSPLLRITGAGKVMLPERQVDYTVRPKLVSEAAGQGGTIDLAGIEVPVRITGSWDDPKFTPDLSKVDVGQAAKAIEQLGKNLKGKNAGEIVDELLGKDSKEADQAKKLLDKLFR